MYHPYPGPLYHTPAQNGYVGSPMHTPMGPQAAQKPICGYRQKIQRAILSDAKCGRTQIHTAW